MGGSPRDEPPTADLSAGLSAGPPTGPSAAGEEPTAELAVDGESTVELAAGDESTVELSPERDQTDTGGPPAGEEPTEELAADSLAGEDGPTEELVVAEQPLAPRRRRRGGGCLLTLVVLALVLGGLLLVADRFGVGYAEELVAEQVVAEMERNRVYSEPPVVTIDGRPFLTQVVRGRYERVRLESGEVRSPEITLSDVELVATGVTASVGTLWAGEGPIDAELLEGRATIAYDEVVPLIGIEGLELSAGQDGAVRVRVPVQLLGQRLTVVGEAGVRVTEDGRIDLRVRELALEEGVSLPPIAEPILQDLIDQLPLDTQLPPLPYGLTVDSVSAEAAGFVVTVSATDVPLAR